jgi:hypothetical protein
MTAELAVYEPSPVALPARTGIPGTQDFDSWVAVASDVIKLANVICDTPFVPDGLRGSGPAVAAAILAGREMNLGPMTSLANIDVIKGKPSQKALLMRAMILSQGHKWQDGDVTDTRAVVRGCRKGEAEWAEVVFTADQAKRAGIDLGKYPADKLYARATSRLARRKFADVIMGMPYSSEEREDGTDEDGEPAATPAAIAPAAPAQRTARRRQAADKPAEPKPDPTPASGAGSAPTSEATPADAPAQTARPARPSDGLPPLPGEEDEQAAQPPYDPDEHGTSTRGKGGQLTALWTVLSEVYGFTGNDKAAARKAVEHIISRDLDGETTGDLSYNEARTVLDTLARWQTIAESRGEQPMDVLVAVMAGGPADG